MSARLSRAVERWALRVLWRLLWPEVRYRRRVSRPLAAWHLLRHGAVIYGVQMRAPLLLGRNTERHVLVSQCYFETNTVSQQEQS